MADNIVVPINKTVDISQGTLYTTLGLQNTNDQLIQGQSYANVLNVSVNNGGVPVELSGECMGYFVRQQDGSTVQVAGTISGNVASVEFPSFVYAYTGRLTITLNVGGTALVQIATTVRLGSTFVVVDPGNVLPNLDEIQQIMLDVESALNQLSSALTASQQATQAANTAAGAANTAAGAANTAAATANTAAAALNGLTATANTLEPTQPATATAQLVDGAWKITLGIPQGIQGIQGVRGITAYQGSAITGTSTTPTAYATGIASALAGDLYLYTGTDNANIGNVYTCTQGGDASTALWAYATNWRGEPGSGNVSTVNGFQPDQEGNVNLPGQIYSCTATALEAMSQEQQAELYTQGYRAIKTENSGTVVLLGLAPDGSLEWLGCNQPRQNLLDNPDFAVAQAGYGGMHGIQKYACDRWFAENSATINHSSGILTFDAAIQQRVSTTLSGYITIAVCMGDGTIRVAAGDASENVVGTGFYYDAAGNTFIVQPSIGSLKWAAVYNGSYSVKTLPPWEAPKNVFESLKCFQYYFRTNGIFSGMNNSNSSVGNIFIPLPVKMAHAGGTPVVTGSLTSAIYLVDSSGTAYTSGSLSVSSVNNAGIILSYNISSSISRQPVFLVSNTPSAPLEINNDL